MKPLLFLVTLIVFTSYGQERARASKNVEPGKAGSVQQVMALSRGPYLQIGTPTSVIIRWRTSNNTSSKVTYGTSLSNLNLQVTNSTAAAEHEIQISGLAPSTVYYYTIGSTTTALTTASAAYYFKTSPLAGTTGKYRFWAIGDAGTGNGDQTAVRDAFLAYNNGQHTDGWIMLGDNAYNNGYDSQYQTGVFQNMYESILQNTVLWPAAGNHDYNNHIPFSPSPAYFDNFSLPTAGEAGGLASGTEKYYSYDYGNIHFIVLDSYDVSRSATGVMATWLQNDLNANTQKWVIAYWHHPPYTKGTHNSDNPNFLDGELPEIRQNIIPILEASGVDLVVNGHSHVYERSYLVDGHYGSSGQLQPSMILDSGSGNYPASCPYQKQDEVVKSHKGTVYVVCGCSGKNGSTASGWPHPVFYAHDNTVFGSMLFEIEDNQLNAKFITSTGTVNDEFTIIKNASKKKTFNACPGDQLVLKPSWKGNVQWFPGGSTQDSLVITASVATVYFADEPLNCMKDTFVITILPTPPCVAPVGIHAAATSAGPSVYPNAVQPGTDITIQFGTSTSVNPKEDLYCSVYTVTGQLVKKEALDPGNNNAYTLRTTGLAAGIYYLKLDQNYYRTTQKIIITE